MRSLLNFTWGLLLISIPSMTHAEDLSIKVIAFDLFGTVLDPSTTPTDEFREYVRHVRSEGDWSPLSLPESWKSMPAFPDSAEGLRKLRERYIVVTLSNAPIQLQTAINRHNQLNWDYLIPLESIQKFKPKLTCYQLVQQTFRVKPAEVLMVTGNATAGDIEGARALGQKAVLIRGDSPIKNIIELDRWLQDHPAADVAIPIPER